ncbi:MAG: hypothetical protein HYR51_04260 [Candidatus Rokubacteria bacterium]|nr:hypothetical protein [Candidatus Rokubacteria bacterium]
MKAWLLAASLLLAPWPAAFAIDVGTVQGSLQVDGVTVALTHAFAHLHDNAERLLHRPRELRILLADREVPRDALGGIALPALMRMAREGRVRGLLLRLDADQPTREVLTPLRPPVDPDQPVVVRKISVAHNRVTGEIEYGDRLRFSAPLFSERRVTEDLRGEAARQSVQARVLGSTQGLERIVVRGDRATAIFTGGKWLTLVRETAGWRTDD